jgi:hypothetical protein
MGCLSQEIEGTVSRRDGAAGQVCLRERVPGTPQPAGVRPGYKRAAGFLYPLRCYYPRKESEGKSRHIITIENRTRSAAGTAQRDRIPNLTTKPGKKKWKRAMSPGNPGGTTMEQSQATRKSGGMTMEQSRWNGKQDSTEVQVSKDMLTLFAAFHCSCLASRTNQAAGN